MPVVICSAVATALQIRGKASGHLIAPSYNEAWMRYLKFRSTSSAPIVSEKQSRQV
jgi:hypothetical protein